MIVALIKDPASGGGVTRHFLTLLDFSPEELSRLIDRAIEHKRMREAGTIYEPLRGRTLAMVFDLSVDANSRGVRSRHAATRRPRNFHEPQRHAAGARRAD